MKKVILLLVLLTSGFLVEMKLNKNLNTDRTNVMEIDSSSQDSLASSITKVDPAK